MPLNWSPVSNAILIALDQRANVALARSPSLRQRFRTLRMRTAVRLSVSQLAICLLRRCSTVLIGHLVHFYDFSLNPLDGCLDSKLWSFYWNRNPLFAFELVFTGPAAKCFNFSVFIRPRIIFETLLQTRTELSALSYKLVGKPDKWRPARSSVLAASSRPVIRNRVLQNDLKIFEIEAKTNWTFQVACLPKSRASNLPARNFCIPC